MIPTPTLTGLRVRLEPLTHAHQSALEKIAVDERIWRYFTQPVVSATDLPGWIDSALTGQAAGNSMVWVTVLADTGRVVGSTRFLDIDWKNATTELGFTWLTPEIHGAGINPEAKYLQLRYAFEDLQFRRVALKAHHENLQSQAAMRKLGATYEGTFRNHMIMPDGSARHSVYFSIIREDWPQVKSQLEARLAALPPSV